jgi:hypothetical protein
MAIYSGLAGTVSGLQGVTLASIRSWRMSLVRPVFRYKVWGVLTGDPAIADSYSASGTIECYMDSDQAIAVASFAADTASVSLTLSVVGGGTPTNPFVFSAHLSALDGGASRDSAPATISFGFESDGAIVFTGL